MDKSCIKIGVIGGGASGLLFSYLVKKKLGETISVSIFEKNNKVGKKILVTGNGKCNLSNQNLDAGMYNSSFATKIVSKIGAKEVENVFSELGIITKTDKEGRIYPYSMSANTVLDALYNANIKLKNNIICDHEVKELEYQNGAFLIDKMPFDYCVVACGGKASVNTTNLIGQKLVDLGHKWVKDEPGLCSIITYEDTLSLNGLKVKALVKANGKVFDGEVLFKKNGLSGIAIFEASRFVKANDYIVLDLMSDLEEDKLSNLIKDIDTLKLTFPKMVAKDILDRANGNLGEAIKIIKNYRFEVKAKSGYDNAQIMMGGIDTADVSENLESLIIPKLYILGEVLDVDGTCGGYNLHFAWASAIIASKNIADGLK